MMRFLNSLPVGDMDDFKERVDEISQCMMM